MNRSYQVYLRNQSAIFLKKITVISAIFLFLVIISLFLKNHFAKKNSLSEEQRRKIQISSSRSSAINANKVLIMKAFDELNQHRKDNTENGRQYMIESLTRFAEQSKLSNFVIDSISEKNSILPIVYKDINTIAHSNLFEIEITFNSNFQKQTEEFIRNLNMEINGQVLIQKIEIKRVVKEIDNNVINALNAGQNVSMVNTHLVLHWFFIK
jgi:preprotein translocase subunit SecG